MGQARRREVPSVMKRCAAVKSGRGTLKTVGALLLIAEDLAPWPLKASREEVG
jgi:hypothetical protein